MRRIRRIRRIHSSRLRSNAIPCEIGNTFLEAPLAQPAQPRAEAGSPNTRSKPQLKTKV